MTIRLAAMNWLASFGDRVDFAYDELARFEFAGDRIPLTDRQRGIRKPASLHAALSMRTVYTPPNAAPPYANEVGPDGLPRYKMRGQDPQHPENVALRRAMQDRLPVIWFVGVSPGRYLAEYPVYLLAEEPEQHQFVLAIDEAQRHLGHPGEVVDQDERRWIEQITKQRLHQPLFRARVLAAYGNRCAMCRLRHVSLLDASHIVSDQHVLGQPVVPNGLALCKIHHAAFDQNILGVRPDLRIEVRHDVLTEVDGPMLRHGLQELARAQIEVPSLRNARPDPRRLEVRYEEFRAA